MDESEKKVVMEEMTTKQLFKELCDCKQDEELMQYLKKYEIQQKNWSNYMKEQLALTGLSYEKFGNLCGFSKNTIKSWCEEGVVPRNREHYIKLGFGLNMSEDALNELLLKYGGYPKLYAKDVYDAICIYVLNQHLKNYEDEKYRYSSLRAWEKSYEAFMNCHETSEGCSNENTLDMHEQILSMETDKQFLNYIKEKETVFCTSYSKLINYMEEFIKIRRRDYSENFELISIHALFCMVGLDESFEVAYSKLKKHGIVPKRQQLISFGVAMEMTKAEIDLLLKYANMCPLYVRNRLECIIIYLLNMYERVHPVLTLENAFKMEQLTKNQELRNMYRQVIHKFYEVDDEEEMDDEVSQNLNQFINAKIKQFEYGE